MLNNLYSLKYVIRSAHHANRFRDALQRMVCEELRIVPQECVAGHEMESWRERTRQTLERTLFRKAHRTRAILDSAGVDDALKLAVHEQQLTKREQII